MKLEEKAPPLYVKFRSDAQREYYMKMVRDSNKCAPDNKLIGNCRDPRREATA